MEGGGDKIMNKVWIHLYDRFILSKMYRVLIYLQKIFGGFKSYKKEKNIYKSNSSLIKINFQLTKYLYVYINAVNVIFNYIIEELYSIKSWNYDLMMRERN